MSYMNENSSLIIKNNFINNEIHSSIDNIITYNCVRSRSEISSRDLI